MQKHYHIKTYGCQMNIYDTQRMENLLRPMNYAPTEDIEKADFILFNTCTVREKAKHKFVSDLGRLKPLKAKRKDLIIGMGGCVAQEEGEKLLKKVRHLDFVFELDQIDQLPTLLKNVQKNKTQVSLTAFDTDPKFSLSYIKPNYCPTSAYVTVIKGCDKFCSFCIVPFTRGLEKSRAPREILQEIEAMVQGGTREITLLGQNVNSYDYEKIYFPALLKMVNDIEELKRIRYTSPHPQDFDDAMIDCHATLDKLCQHIHMPVQCGNNDVLKQMRRWYTIEHYKEQIQKLRDKVPEISVSTDIIVGFPGETEKQFEDTLQLLKDVQYDFVFSFKYSERSGTKAAQELKDDLSESEKNRRLYVLQTLQDEISLEKNKKLEGQIQEVLVEKKSTNDQLQGRTETNKIVHFHGEPSLIGQFTHVRLEKAMPHSFLGKQISA